MNRTTTPASHGNRTGRVLVVGSGIAGLTTALEAAARGLAVTLISKDRLDEAGTAYAQGGIAAMTAALPAGQLRDHAGLHVADTLLAGAGLCDDDAVRLLVRGSPVAIDELVGRGVAFDREDGPASPWVQGLEGAHSVARILHAGGDATGRAIERALVAAALAAEDAGRLQIHRHTMLVDVLRSSAGAAVGVTVLGPAGTLRTLRVDAVVLATGGAGQLYPYTTNPAVATGDGIAAALRAGAAVADLEFVQFHPTALAEPGCFLVSEAVRGEGAVLRDERGERFLAGLHSRAELAPRDVVAREIVRASLAQGGRPVVLDCTGLTAPEGAGTPASSPTDTTTAAFLAHRFPTIDAAVRARGFDWAREPVPVTPAAHYLMGGVATDDAGRTTVPGLYAVGECAATGVHGANRLASNSLLEGAVFGSRVAHAVAEDLARAAPHDGAAPRLSPRGTALMPFPAYPEGATPFDRRAFQAAMWAGAGVLRNGPALETLSRRLAELRAPEPSSRTAVEDRNLLTVGRAVVAAALHRTESRGAHFRADRPAPDPAQARRSFWRLDCSAAPRVRPAVASTYAATDIFERTPAC